MGPGVAGRLVEPDPGDVAEGVDLELDADLGRRRVTGVLRLRDDGRSPDRAGAGHVHRGAGGRGLDVAAVVHCARLDLRGRAPMGDPRVAPRDRRVGVGHGGDGVPGGAAVGRDLDAGHHTATCIVADPLMVTADPFERLAFCAGDVIVEVGAVASVDGVAAVSPAINEAGCTLPMSANRFTVACCMAVSVALVVPPLSSPHAHCTVPAPNTRAPLGAR